MRARLRQCPAIPWALRPFMPSSTVCCGRAVLRVELQAKAELLQIIPNTEALLLLRRPIPGNIGCDRNLQQELFGRSLCLTQLGCPQSPLCLHAGPLISRVEVPVAAVLVFPLGSRGCGSARELSPHRPIASERMLQVSSCLSAPSDSAPASGVLSRPRH